MIFTHTGEILNLLPVMAQYCLINPILLKSELAFPYMNLILKVFIWSSETIQTKRNRKAKRVGKHYKTKHEEIYFIKNHEKTLLFILNPQLNVCIGTNV